MAVLEGFPLISQQTKISADGSSPNAELDCVPTSILAGLMYLHGITNLSPEWNPDKLLDMAYPEGYTGGTAASAFVKACATLGCKLYPLSGTPGQLVQHIHEQLQQGHPCIVTVPDIYVPASYGWTHVLCAYSEQPGQITMLDPWPGKPTVKSDAEWINLLLFNQIWVLERSEEVPITIDLNNPEVAKYFELANSEGTQWRCRLTGKIIQFGILDAYKAYGNSALCGLTFLGLPQSNEVPLPDIPGAVKQYFERGTLIYDVAHKNDSPPGAGAVYPAHLYTGPAQDPRVSQIAPLQSQVSQLQAQVKQLQEQAITDTVVNPQAIQELQAKIAQIKAIVS